ncbi:twin arginine-targeting protein translocase TatB [Novosphingobium sp. PC22D]|uniref:Sec-independent protein translocase protein TatB n=1 Tax=Novosphingobium sp. PC22D TaxID=1962403 RepID=UPI000BEFCE28|nr:Sec-independent protein translocase protein TatB [Novosphingobium sp. PC22D]PEQ12911.1 twin arginine-targeting protein translocase TatB [Novosphingobium sp. PC22D]
MFDIGAPELLVVVIVAIFVIGPKDMPMALRTVGRWVGKMRKISGHFRAGLDAMVREAELEDMEKKWREQNEAIMKATPSLPSAEEMQPVKSASASAEDAAAPPAKAQGATPDTETKAEPAGEEKPSEPQLPLSPP